MENRNIDTNCNRNNLQCSSSRELELERKLMKESTRLDDADTYRMPYEQSIKIYIKQEEMYNKWKLLKGIKLDNTVKIEELVGMTINSDRTLKLSDNETTRSIITFKKINEPKTKLPSQEGMAQKKPL